MHLQVTNILTQTRDVVDPSWAIENDRQAPVEKPKAKKD